MAAKQDKSIQQNKANIDIVQGTKAYIELRERITKEGILNRAYGFYTLLILSAFFGFFFSIFMIYRTTNPLFLIFWCLTFTFFGVQIGGLVHDAAHRAIAKSPKMNDILGNIFASFIVAGYGNWKTTHNKHHAHTNKEDEDPDLDLPLHGFTKRQFEKQKGLWKVLRKYQVYFYYPLRTLVAFTYRTDNYKYLKTAANKEKIVIGSIWITGLFIWFILPFLIFPLGKALIIFFVINFASGFYLSNIFAPNHKGMPQLPKNVKISFLEHQIMTSRNISGHWLTDYVFLGLNYQIEHHLFPNCSRNKLKLITPHVLAICREMNLEYTKVSILESNRIILSELNKTAKLHS